MGWGGGPEEGRDFSAPGLETAFAFAPSPEKCVLEPWFKELECKYSGCDFCLNACMLVASRV